MKAKEGLLGLYVALNILGSSLTGCAGNVVATSKPILNTPTPTPQILPKRDARCDGGDGLISTFEAAEWWVRNVKGEYLTQGVEPLTSGYVQGTIKLNNDLSVSRCQTDDNGEMCAVLATPVPGAYEVVMNKKKPCGNIFEQQKKYAIFPTTTPTPTPVIRFDPSANQ